ncbi:MAG: putative N-acetylmannosamine-6-phosphate 2-epimerase [Streptosporangiales bacterium]|nr:putative N-acetylmannosamine-6-phosphate 2-epimerase [Streptosporangiales bacterium]
MKIDVPFPHGSLLVSCQAKPPNPLHGPETMALMARAAEAGNAAGIRANGPDDVAAIRGVTELPIIGINKIGDPAGVFITPTPAAAAAVVEAGATMVAIDGTDRPRPDGRSLAEHVDAIHADLQVAVMADVDTVANGEYARAGGADVVASTLSGYTAGTERTNAPDVELVAELARRLDCPIVAEGRYWTRSDVAAALTAGAYAVIVGTAITNPMEITKRLAAVTPTAG